MMSDCDCEGRIFLSTLYTHDGVFSCTVFISERRFFNNGVTSIADVRHIVMAFNDVITFSDINLNDGVHDVNYNQCISNT